MSDTTPPPFGPPRVLLISHDVVGDSMAGPGIRYLTLARVLAQHCPLTFAIPNAVPASLQGEAFAIHQYRRGDWTSIKLLAQRFDVLVFNTDIASDFPELAGLDASLVVDGYDPMMAEWLATHAGREPASQMDDWRARSRQLQEQVELGWGCWRARDGSIRSPAPRIHRCAS